MSSIEQARQEVDRCVNAAVRAVTDAEDGSAAEVESVVWTSLLALGRALMRLFLEQRGDGWRRGTTYAVGPRTFRVSGTETTWTGTRFGRVRWERPVARAEHAPRGKRDRPLDRELGLPGGFTLPVVLTMARLCAQMAFGAARSLHSALFEWSPSSRAVLRMVDSTGKQARPFLEQAAAPDDDGEVLVITADGKGAPAISSKEYARRTRPHRKSATNRRHRRRDRRHDSPRVRRGPGKKSKNAKVATVGVLYTLRRDADGRLDGPINKRVIATFETARALFVWLKAEAVKRGYGTSRFSKVLFIADGLDHLWQLQREFFPDAEVCLDWYHAVEKLWAAGKAICRRTRRRRRQLEAWVAEQKRRLRRGQLGDILAALRAALAATSPRGPGNKYRREVLAEVLAHFEKNAPRMRYAALRRQDLDISSGVVEGAVRHLVGVRLDGPGMRWGRDRAEAVLHLRCILINGLWNDFEAHVARLQTLRLPPIPLRARTHDAVTKQAA